MLRKEQLSKKETALDDLGQSQAIQIAKDANVGRFIDWKEGQLCGWKNFTEEIRCMTHGSNQQSQQKPGIEMGLSRNDL